MNDREYEDRSLSEANRHEREVDHAPLADRKEAQREFGRAMAAYPALVAERIGWLIGGNYGHGEMLKAKRVLTSPRMNREAALVQLVGVYEWQCPGEMTRAAWKKLTASQKAALDAAVKIVIDRARAEED